MTAKVNDLAGCTVNHLTVEGPAGHNEYGHRLWWCRCTCGNRVMRTTNNFRRSYSCGCTHRKSSTQGRSRYLVSEGPDCGRSINVTTILVKSLPGWHISIPRLLVRSFSTFPADSPRPTSTPAYRACAVRFLADRSGSDGRRHNAHLSRSATTASVGGCGSGAGHVACAPAASTQRRSVMQFNIHNGNGRRDYPSWNTRVKILAVDAEGNAREGEYDFGGEVFERLPRFIRGGHTYRLRPVRPLAVLAAMAFSSSSSPPSSPPRRPKATWARNSSFPTGPSWSRRFDNLSSPLADKDTSVKPSPINGWSFTELQVLCRECGVANGSNGASDRS